MTLQKVIDKLIKLSNCDDDRAKVFQNYITKVEIKYENHLILTFNEKGKQGDKK